MLCINKHKIIPTGKSLQSVLSHIFFTKTVARLNKVLSSFLNPVTPDHGLLHHIVINNNTKIVFSLSTCYWDIFQVCKLHDCCKFNNIIAVLLKSCIDCKLERNGLVRFFFFLAFCSISNVSLTEA